MFQQQQNEQDQEWKQKSFDYQKERDTVADQQYADKMQYQRERDAVTAALNNRNFEYQKSRDTVNDTQWTQQFEQQVKQWENSNNQWERELAEQIRQFDILHPQPGTATGGGGGGYSGSSKKKSGSGTGAANTQTQQPVSDKTLMDLLDQDWTVEDALNALKTSMQNATKAGGALNTTQKQANNLTDKEKKAQAAYERTTGKTDSINKTGGAGTNAVTQALSSYLKNFTSKATSKK